MNGKARTQGWVADAKEIKAWHGQLAIMLPILTMWYDVYPLLVFVSFFEMANKPEGIVM